MPVLPKLKLTYVFVSGGFYIPYWFYINSKTIHSLADKRSNARLKTLIFLLPVGHQIVLYDFLKELASAQQKRQLSFKPLSPRFYVFFSLFYYPAIIYGLLLYWFFILLMGLSEITCNLQNHIFLGWDIIFNLLATVIAFALFCIPFLIIDSSIAKLRTGKENKSRKGLLISVICFALLTTGSIVFGLLDGPSWCKKGATTVQRIPLFGMPDLK